MSEVMAVHDDEKPVLDRHQVTSTHRTPHESRPNTQFEVHVLFSIMFGEHICYNGTMYRNPNTRCFLFRKAGEACPFRGESYPFLQRFRTVRGGDYQNSRACHPFL